MRRRSQLHRVQITGRDCPDNAEKMEHTRAGRVLDQGSDGFASEPRAALEAVRSHLPLGRSMLSFGMTDFEYLCEECAWGDNLRNLCKRIRCKGHCRFW